MPASSRCHCKTPTARQSPFAFWPWPRPPANPAAPPATSWPGRRARPGRRRWGRGMRSWRPEDSSLAIGFPKRPASGIILLMLDLIAFDADDTLWHTEHLYSDAQARFGELLAPYGVAEPIEDALF